MSEEIGRAVATGKVMIGSNRTLKSMRRGWAKLVVVASNCPPDLLSDIDRYSKLAGVRIYSFNGDNRELGLACGQPFAVNAAAIVDQGSSSILSAVEKR